MTSVPDLNHRNVKRFSESPSRKHSKLLVCIGLKITLSALVADYSQSNSILTPAIYNLYVYTINMSSKYYHNRKIRAYLC